jgi:hypothetical protein
VTGVRYVKLVPDGIPENHFVTDDDGGEAVVLMEAGGLVDDTAVTLVLYADFLDPEVVTGLIGIAPTSARRKGQRAGPRSPPGRTGVWLHRVCARSPVGPEELCRELLLPSRVSTRRLGPSRERSSRERAPARAGGSRARRSYSDAHQTGEQENHVASPAAAGYFMDG